MINGIIKLFYSEVVKVKMKGMPKDNYELREECKEIRNIAYKIDSLLLKLIKLIGGLIVVLIAFNINVLLGVGIILLGITYIMYRQSIEVQVKEKINNLKGNIQDYSNSTIISEKGKIGMNLLASLLLIGMLTSFNIPIVISFMTVFVFTIKDIYSNIK